MDFLTEHEIDIYPDRESRVAEISATNKEVTAAPKTVEYCLQKMAVLIKNVTTYKQTRPMAIEYRRAVSKAQLRQMHESALILYEGVGIAEQCEKATWSGLIEVGIYPADGENDTTSLKYWNSKIKLSYCV